MRIGLPHFSHLMPMSTGLITLPSASTSIEFRHAGYPLQPRNFLPFHSRKTIGLPHFSHLCSVVRADTTGLPSASKFIVVLHSGAPAQTMYAPKRPSF